MMQLIVFTPRDELAVIIEAPWIKPGLFRRPRAVNDR